MNGQPVTPEIQLLAGNWSSDDPTERSPADIETIRNFANSIVDKFNALSDGANPLAVRDTPTGAEIIGLLMSRDSTPVQVAVPAESVAMVTVGTTSVMFVASSQSDTVNALQSNGLILTDGGNLALRITGVDPGVEAEIVLVSTRQLLGKFTTGSGATTVQTRLPRGMTKGVDSVAVVAGSTRISVRAAILPDTLSGTLPVTGSGTGLVGPALVLLALGLVMSTRRRARTTT